MTVQIERSIIFRNRGRLLKWLLYHASNGVMICCSNGIVISYRFSHVPLETVHQLVDPIYNILKTNGIDVFCNFYENDKYEKEHYAVKAIMYECFSILDTKDTILCLVDTAEYSCGMILEVGYAVAKGKEVIVCSREGCQIKTLDHIATKTLTYKDYDDLLAQIKVLFNL